MSLAHPAWPEILSGFCDHFREPEAITCTEWNEKYRRLPTGLRFRAWPWQIEPLNAPSDPDVGELILIWPSQVVGKSEVLLGLLAYQIATRIGDYLLVMPTLPQAERWSRTRWSNTVKHSALLQKLLPGQNQRTLASSGSKLLFKSFTNGSNLAIATANSAPSLVAASIVGLYADETDLWPRELLNEGSPFSLAARRLTSFSDSIFVQASSPTIAGESHIVEEYERSDQRTWVVPCPVCSSSFELKWANVIWDKTESGKHRVETARIRCACGAEHDDGTRRLMILNGRWEVRNPEERRVRGYWMSGFNVLLPTRKGYVSRLHEQAVEFLAAKGNPVTLAPWINTVAGEVFVREKVKALPAEFLLDRREAYFGDCLIPDQETVTLPTPVLALTGGIDVQKSHIESLIIGWARDKSSFVIDHRQWMGNPAQAASWAPLGAYLMKPWKLGSGHQILPALTFCDSGYLPQPVHEFCQKAPHRWPSKGIASVALPWVERSADKKRRIMLVHVDAGKFLFFSRLALTDPKEAGFIHLHMGLDAEFCRQLTSEVAVEDRRANRLVFRRAEGRERNEALDLMILCMAAEEWARLPYDRLEKQWGPNVQGPNPPEGAPGPAVGPTNSPVRPPRPRNPWGRGGIGALARKTHK
jgi:phage terminase large subunit GpA-like protein